MDKIAAVVVVALIGLLVALQGATGGLMAKAGGGSPLPIAAVTFASALAITVAALLFLPLSVDVAGLRRAPWYGWVGGLYAVGIFTGGAWATPKLGAGVALVVTLTMQASLGLALDHFGLLGLEKHAASPLRIGGVLVMAAGAFMVSKG